VGQDAKLTQNDHDLRGFDNTVSSPRGIVTARQGGLAVNKVPLIYLALIVAAVLFALVGCDEVRNRSACHKVADLHDGLQKRDLRAFDQLEDLSNQEIELLSAVTHSDSNEDPFTLCMRVIN
jgi:hypothetical protein